ncbi:MAG: hypothetical protein H6836_05570 [Planctomycetes bacterium]|nr:hypothetical protein [Planctomycetota bacterium]MCB9889026.1 hypothetical protein [Planctomycetota bacterium]
MRFTRSSMAAGLAVPVLLLASYCSTALASPAVVATTLPDDLRAVAAHRPEPMAVAAPDELRTVRAIVPTEQPGDPRRSNPVLDLVVRGPDGSLLHGSVGAIGQNGDLRRLELRGSALRIESTDGAAPRSLILESDGFVPVTVRPDPNARNEARIDVRLARAGGLCLTLRDATGVHLVGRRLTCVTGGRAVVVCRGGEVLRHGRRFGETDGQGQVRFADLPPGPCQVRADGMADWLDAEAGFEVVEGVLAAVEVVAPRRDPSHHAFVRIPLRDLSRVEHHEGRLQSHALLLDDGQQQRHVPLFRVDPDYAGAAVPGEFGQDWSARLVTSVGDGAWRRCANGTVRLVVGATVRWP